MTHDEEEAAIIADMTALVKRAMALGAKQEGSRLNSILDAARAQISGQIEQTTSKVLTRPTLDLPLRTPGKRRRSVLSRAPSGSIARHVQSVLERALTPMRVNDIIDEAKARFDITLKDTSVRMALGTMQTKGEVQRNDIGEWHMPAKKDRSSEKMPRGDNQVITHEAA